MTPLPVHASLRCMLLLGACFYSVHASPRCMLLLGACFSAMPAAACLLWQVPLDAEVEEMQWVLLSPHTLSWLHAFVATSHAEQPRSPPEGTEELHASTESVITMSKSVYPVLCLVMCIRVSLRIYGFGDHYE
jgi:hypothetical protein